MQHQANCGRRDELIVLGVIALGLIIITLSVVLGLFFDDNGLPNWAENVLVAIATAAALKLGDCISALVQLATGKSVESFGNQLAQSAPQETRAAPETAKAAADEVADAATEAASRITEEPEK